MAIDYQRLASYLAYSQSSPPATRVSEDCLTIFYRAHSLHVPDWRLGLQRMLAKLVSAQDTLIAGADHTMHIPPTISDDWVDETRGYSWLKNSDCGVPEHVLLQHLMADTSLNLVTIDRDGRLLHNIAAYHRILAQISEITWLLAFLCYMVPGQVTRAMEFVDHKISNSTRPRTIFRNGTDFWLVIRRAKYENNIGKAVFIPSLVPPQLQRELERYLLLIRPLERVLSATVYGLSSIHIYDEYLWVTFGQRITGDIFCKEFPHAMLKYCQCPVGIHDYRQLVVQISRTYLGSENEMNDEEERDVFAAQRGHSVQTARRIYAPELGHLPSISSEALLRFASGSKDWWSVAGFIPGEPPKLPLIQRRQLGFGKPLAPSADSNAPHQSSPSSVDISTHFQNLTATLLHQIASSEARMEERIRMVVAESVAAVMLRMNVDPTPTRANAVQPVPMISSSIDVSHYADASSAPVAVPAIDDVTMEVDDLYAEGFEHREDIMNADLSQGLVQLFPDTHNPQFKSEVQREVVKLSYQRTDNFVAVMPTGSGKSLAWLLPAILDRQGDITFVIIPNRDLLLDQLAHTQAFKIPTCQWTVAKQDIRDSKIVYLALESAASNAFAM